MTNDDTTLILGSSPSRGTIFTKEISENGDATQENPNISGQIEAETERDVKFPKRLRQNGKGKVWATIYLRPEHPRYRLYWRATIDGKKATRTKDFATYSAAKKAGDDVVKELAKGLDSAKLTPGQASDALAAFEGLQRHYHATGDKLSLRAVVAEHCEALAKLKASGHTLGEALDRFINTVAVVQRKSLKEAVVEYIAHRQAEVDSKVKAGKGRPPSAVYQYNVAMWLNEFAGTFQNTVVCDLTKELLDTYIGNFKELSPKSRNDRRAVVKMFLRDWCVPKDYLSRTHRLFEAVGFKAESADAADIDFFRPKELRDMLHGADAELLPVIALGGLAGLRREEILRLAWSDVWRVKGKVEISARIAKGRKRRLVSISPALAAWLRPYRQASGPVWGKSADALEDAQAALRDAGEIPARRNGLRHSFITFHMAMHCNENLTAAEAGNSPQMIHDHYRALATRSDAVKWFSIKPTKAAGAANVIQLSTKAMQ